MISDGLIKSLLINYYFWWRIDKICSVTCSSQKKRTSRETKLLSRNLKLWNFNLHKFALMLFQIMRNSVEPFPNKYWSIFINNCYHIKICVSVWQINSAVHSMNVDHSRKKVNYNDSLFSCRCINLAIESCLESYSDI